MLAIFLEVGEIRDERRNRNRNETIKLDLSLEDLNNTYADRYKHLWESNQELELKTIMLNVQKYIVVTSQN